MKPKSKSPAEPKPSLREYSRQLLLSFLLWSSDWVRALNIGVRISILSILALVIIGLLIWMDQGYTLIIDLLDRRPYNLLLFWILLWGLREIISHYPTYLDKWRIHRNQVFNDHIYLWRINYSGFPKWSRAPLLWLKSWGIGFITYKKIKLDDEREAELDYYEQTIHRKVDIFRRFLGLFLFGVVIYAICRCWIRQIDPTLEPKLINLGNWLVVLIPTIYFSSRYVANLASQNSKLREHGRLLTLLLFYLVMLVKLAAVFASGYFGWSVNTVAIVVVALIFEVVSFCMFKNFRSYFNTDSKTEKTAWMEPPFFSNYSRYLVMIGLTGLVALNIIVISHFKLYFFSPIVIVLAYLHLFYGVVIIPTKHYFFYLNYRRERYQWRRSLIPAFPILLLAFSIYASSKGNDLHLLPLQKQDPQKIVTLDTFVNKMYLHFNDTTASPARDTVYFIASYGGGLKANIWNMLVLNELSQRKGQNVLEKTVAMSGVSGGALGLAFFSALYAQHPGGEDCHYHQAEYTSSMPSSSSCYQHRLDIIKKMGSTNMLSMDATYALGADLIRELRTKRGAMRPDRAKIAMHEYGKLLEENEAGTRLDSVTYQNIWYELFMDQLARESFYPMLLMNSAGTHTQRGVSATVDMGVQFDSIFHDAIDLAVYNEQRDQGLSYLHTASTTNRFPVASPTAKIAGKGHFLDGGYFENSGMLSIWNFYTYLNKKHPDFFTDKVVRFIQISKDKYNVIHDDFGRQLNDSVKISETAELGAIVTTVTSISMLPRYLQRYMENYPGICFSNIHLPYLLLESDFLAFRKGETLDSSDLVAMQEYNNKVRKALEPSETYERIAPPLARLLGPQAVRYMELVIADGMVFEELDEGKKCSPITNSNNDTPPQN